MAARKEPTSNLAAARSGDRRAALEVLRDTLAASMDVCEPTMHAQLAGQYRAVLAELSSLPVAEAVSKRDELKQRRAARAAGRGATPGTSARSG